MKDDSVYLAHIRDCIERIVKYTRDGHAAFVRDPMVQDAVIRNFEVIGEAVKNLSRTLRDAHAEVPWKKVAAFRDLLIHRYFGVKLEPVWDIIQNDLPSLQTTIEALLKLHPLRPEDDPASSRFPNRKDQGE